MENNIIFPFFMYSHQKHQACIKKHKYNCRSNNNLENFADSWSWDLKLIAESSRKGVLNADSLWI